MEVHSIQRISEKGFITTPKNSTCKVMKFQFEKDLDYDQKIIFDIASNIMGKKQIYKTKESVKFILEQKFKENFSKIVFSIILNFIIDLNFGDKLFINDTNFLNVKVLKIFLNWYK
jgi:hypothetical protein